MFKLLSAIFEVPIIVSMVISWMIGGPRGHSVASRSSILGGDTNAIEGASFASITGGRFNQIQGGSNFTHLGGGDSNKLASAWTVLVGGHANQLDYNADYSYLGGGDSNYLTGDHSFLGAGKGNRLTFLCKFSSLVGGDTNFMHADYASIGGGHKNYINVGGDYATIPGGDSLIAQSYAQTVIGYNNIAGGSTTKGGSHVGNDDPLFIIGNGNKPLARSDAFLVSYDGHATVFDNNGNIRNAFYGATYQDNTIVAWGDVDITGTLSQNFGVASVTNLAPGLYSITLNVKDAFGGAIALTKGSITVTVNDDSGDPNTSMCGYATASHLGVGGTNTFTVHTYAPLCER